MKTLVTNLDALQKLELDVDTLKADSREMKVRMSRMEEALGDVQDKGTDLEDKFARMGDKIKQLERHYWSELKTVGKLVCALMILILIIKSFLWV